MTSAQHTFGEQKQPHTVIIARGEKVRHFTISSRLVGLSGAVAIALFAGCASTACYLLLQDDLRASATDTQLKLQQSYEERIASLRSQLDRAVSRQMLDQQLVESKVDALIGQQVELSARYEKLQPLLDRARSTGLLEAAIPVPQPKPSVDSAILSLSPSEAPKPLSFLQGTSNSALARFNLVDHSGAELWLRREAEVQESKPVASPSHALIQQIGQSIDSVEDGQIANLTSLAEKARDRAGSIATALRSEGISVPDLQLAAVAGGEGGPFVAVPPERLFDASFQELDRALTELQLLKQKTTRLPLAAPVESRLISSAFGVRSDPFLGESAMHTGIDFVAASGSAVEATAAGTVTQAAANGGYGNMVEIDHGGGMVTRYGHMSSIAVSVGDKVTAGQIVGRVGTTGRSTGPHLHYEVRRDGNPIDPSRFLRAGRKLDAVV